MNVVNSGLKRSRATRACDFCHKRGRKCQFSTTGTHDKCMTCVQYAVSCTWTRVAAKRGVKPRVTSLDVVPTNWTIDTKRHGSRALLEILIKTFFSDVYPIVMTVNEQAFLNDWNAGQIPNARGSFARLMAICGLSSYRIKSGASLANIDDTELVDSDLYLQEAISAILKSSSDADELEILQAIGLVCITAQESGNAELLHQSLGTFYAVIAKQGFCDERRWAKDLSEREREDRRRLYWHMYRLEIHTSLVLGHVIRLPELQSAIAYPSIPDEDYTESDDENLEWLTGWNFVTDIYRGLEHLIVYFRSWRLPSDQTTRKLSTRFMLDNRSQEYIVTQLTEAFENLPERFKKADPISSDVRRNRCGFQAANIICTYQLMKMVSFTVSEATFHEACQTALEMIEEMSTIPATYLRAMSLAMLQELAGFGHILSSFIGKELPKSDYEHLRSVLLCMSEFLESLDSCMASAENAGKRLREYVTEIDQFLERLQNQGTRQMENQIAVNSDLPDEDELYIPLEYLQRIPWPGEWPTGMLDSM